MGKILECGGNKAFKDLEQCHEIQGEFKKIPLYYLKNNFNNEERNKKNKLNNIYDEQINDKENELNLIIYNNDDFHQDKLNSKNNENGDYIYKIMDSIKLKKAKISKSFDKDKNKYKDKNSIKSNNLLGVKDCKDITNKLNNKENIKDKPKKIIKRRLIYNNSENNINNHLNWNNKKKKDINERKINSNQNQNKIINNIYNGGKNKQINYVKYNSINHNKFLNENEIKENKKEKMCELISKKIEDKLKKQNDNSIKRNKSQQIKNSFSKSENNINSKLRYSLKSNKGNYAFNPRTKPKPLLNINKATPSENESRRITYLSSENKSPKSTNDNYFKTNEEDFINLNKDSKINNTLGHLKNKNNFYKFIPHNLDKDKQIELLADKNYFDLNNYNFNIKRRHHSDNLINNYKKEKDGNDSIIKSKDNKDIIKVKIQFKGTQINKTLLNNSVNNIFILNYNLLSKISNNSILYDGNIYKITNTKKGESKLIMRYFQITKLYFRYFNNVQSLLLPNNKPLDFFEIKKIKNIEIIDINLLKNKNKNEYKIKFAFVVNLIENINFFIFATNDKEFGLNIINILNLIKKYFDDGKDLFK